MGTAGLGTLLRRVPWYKRYPIVKSGNWWADRAKSGVPLKVGALDWTACLAVDG